MPEPLLRIHYLGHSSFVLRFDNGVSVLTDYGHSNSFGLDSPIHELGGLEPDVVLYSHHDPDHDRGASFPGATFLDGPHLSEEIGIDGIAFQPIRTTENAEGDNTSFLISFDELTVLFAGDCQGDIARIDQPEQVERVQAIFPRHVDLLLVPVDWTRTIARETVVFVGLLEPHGLIPMHYWTPSAKAGFLSLLEEANAEAGAHYAIEESGGAVCEIARTRQGDKSVKVISLEPAPYEG